MGTAGTEAGRFNCFGFGAGNELRAPMALTVIGGLITATVLTLLILPAIYNLLDRKA